MPYIIERLTFPAKAPSYLSQGGYGPTKWTDDINDALRYEFKDEAMMWASFYDDAVARELKFRCRLWLPILNRYAYIKEVIGESTVMWTGETSEAGLFSSNQSQLLSLQYQTEIEAI